MYGNRIPTQLEMTNFTHDDTRGCIFDMTGNKQDIVYSINNPTICKECVYKLSGSEGSKVSNDTLKDVTRELKHIRKGIYQRIIDLIRRKPILSVILSALVGIIISAIGTWLYEFINSIAKQ